MNKKNIRAPGDEQTNACSNIGILITLLYIVHVMAWV